MRNYVLALLFSLLLPSAALADTTYTYTGHDFTTAESPFTTSDFVTVTVTLASPLPANQTSYLFVTPISLIASDGVSTITGTSDSFVEFTTDSSGNILLWDLETAATGAAIASSGSTTSAIGSDFGQLLNSSDTTILEQAQVFRDPGSWVVTSSITATPEPSSIWLLSTGVLGLAGFARRVRRTIRK